MCCKCCLICLSLWSFSPAVMPYIVTVTPLNLQDCVTSNAQGVILNESDNKSGLIVTTCVSVSVQELLGVLCHRRRWPDGRVGAPMSLSRLDEVGAPSVPATLGGRETAWQLHSQSRLPSVQCWIPHRLSKTRYWLILLVWILHHCELSFFSPFCLSSWKVV